MQQRSIELPQGTIHYRETGPADGEPLVFVHGYLMAGDLWDDVTQRLAADGLGGVARPEPFADDVGVQPAGPGELGVLVAHDDRQVHAEQQHDQCDAS